MNDWDKEKIDNFQIISHRIKWVPEKDGSREHFDIDGVYNLYLDEIGLMFEFLQANGDMRLAFNHTRIED